MSEIRDDPWLARILGYDAFRVSLPADTAELDAHSAGRAAAFYDAKIDTADVDAVRELARAGFSVVDVNVTLERGPSTPSPAEVPGVAVADAAPEHEAEVLDIAARCFTFSRFHLDSRIPREAADRVKREWAESYFRKVRGERLLVALREGRPAGFLAILASDGVRTIDLVGVRPEDQSRGVGQALVARFVRDEAPRSDVLRVGTQAANARSLRLYERAGFLIASTQYVMHKHVRDGRSLP